jgi:hypothetical protein
MIIKYKISSFNGDASFGKKRNALVVEVGLRRVISLA